MVKIHTTLPRPHLWGFTGYVVVIVVVSFQGEVAAIAISFITPHMLKSLEMEKLQKIFELN